MSFAIIAALGVDLRCLVNVASAVAGLQLVFSDLY